MRPRRRAAKMASVRLSTFSLVPPCGMLGRCDFTVVSLV